MNPGLTRSGFECPYSDYVSKYVLHRGTKINVYSGSSISFQGIFDKKIDQHTLSVKDVETDMHVQVSVHYCYVITDSNQNFTDKNFCWFVFGGSAESGSRKLVVSGKAYPRQDVNPHWVNGVIRNLPDEYQTKRKLSKKERRRLRLTQSNQPRELVTLNAFVE